MWNDILEEENKKSMYLHAFLIKDNIPNNLWTDFPEGTIDYLQQNFWQMSCKVGTTIYSYMNVSWMWFVKQDRPVLLETYFLLETLLSCW